MSSEAAKCVNHCQHRLTVWGKCAVCSHVCTFAPVRCDCHGVFECPGVAEVKVHTSNSGRRFVDIDDVIKRRLAPDPAESVAEPAMRDDPRLAFAHLYATRQYTKEFESDVAVVKFLIERLDLVERAKNEVYDFVNKTIGRIL